MTNFAPSKVAPAALCTKLSDQDHCQEFAFGAMLGASAEASSLAEQDRWGQAGRRMHATSDLQTAQMCLLHSALLPGGDLRSLQQRCNDADNAMAHAASWPSSSCVVLKLP